MPTKEPYIKRLESRLNIVNLKDYLYDLYITQTKTVREISQIIYGKKTNSSVILNYLHYFDIPIRHGSEAIKTQYINGKDTERKMFSSQNAKINLNSREVKNIMQTNEYKDKCRQSKLGNKNGMFGVTGENHPQWNPDRTHEQRVLERKTLKDKQWRQVVFKKDNYTCQCCGDSIGGNLNAHHLDSYNWCKDKRYDIDNGITLCNDCHKLFHHLYGYGDNTYDQFNEFINNTYKNKTAI